MEKEIGMIMDLEIRSAVHKLVMEHKDWYLSYPCSISGKYHKNESRMRIHIERCVFFAEQFVTAFNISDTDADILYAAVILHDIGLTRITMRGDPHLEGWTYYKETGWSRKGRGLDHPIQGSLVIGEHPFKNSRKIQDLVECHMAHWYKESSRVPVTLLEYLCAACDYLASRDTIVIKGENNG